MSGGTMEVRELTGDAEIEAAFPLMHELRERIRSETFLEEIRRQQAEGYHLYGLFADGELVSLAGVRRSHTLSRGEHLFVDDLVTAKAYQRNGFGRELLRELARVAFLQGIPRIYLDSRSTAKGFYEAVGFTMQTSIPCWIEVEKLAGTIPQP
jgi:GNAT superfamily N-acetyltransferase